MARVDRKKIWQRAVKMDDAWQQGAPDVKFMDISQTQLSGKMTGITDKEKQRDDLLAQAQILDDEITDDYMDLDDTMVNVRNGVVGDKNFGDNSPLYGTMGFIRKEERKSGLTRKKTPPKD